MLLATRCPFCETVFSLQPAQLAQRRGLVRCGHCQEVFDASSSLFDVSEGSDFSKAKPVAAAAAIEALRGERQNIPGFSADAVNLGAPAAARSSGSAPGYSADKTSANTSGSTSGTPLDERLHYSASGIPLAPLPAGGSHGTSTAAPLPRAATEPELPAGGFTAPLPADHEPTLADAPLEPFAYPPDEPHNVAGSPAVSSATAAAASPAPAAAAAAAPATADEAPRVWHKTERTGTSTVDDPALREPADLHGIPDNEPRFGTAGAASTRFGASAAARFGAAAGGSGICLRSSPGGSAKPCKSRCRARRFCTRRPARISAAS
jgi:predicted Zn finger-like uncharacterized protein